MTINISVPQEQHELKPRITVIGVGGAGGNAVNNMIRSNLVGCDFVICNTDAQAMKQSICERRIQLGIGVTRGLGAGSRPDVGRIAAEEALEEIMETLGGANMVFITAGMGGGTGTGAGPVIARAAREAGILTLGVVTKPFQFEGAQRMRTAEAGIQELQKYVDTLIIIPNQNLFRVANEKTTFADAFKMADDVLYSGVRGVTDLMVMPGLINLDFADIRAIMAEMGKAMMGTGEAEGDRRSIDAAEAAISNPLLDDVSMKGAKGVLINITGGPDMTLFEVDEAANRIREEVDPEANIIFGSTFDESLEGRIRISVVATGIDAAAMAQPRPVISLVSDRSRPEAALAATLLPPQPAAAFVMPPIAAAAAAMAATPQPAISGTSALAMAQLQQQSQPQAAAQPLPQAQPVVPKPPLLAPALPEAERIERAIVRDDAFIPPKPVEPQVRPPIVTAPVGSPDPFAAAAMANGGRGQPAYKMRGPSLFERVTGVGRGRAAPAAPPPITAGPVAPPQPAAPQPQQQRLGPLDPADRVTVSKGEEDLLEIPAFLRRQAN
ncbi:MAG TPA: cell division protein FtsZ [Stellaceae bacterium]|jgi:cell division protein FtsZ|nr:cell division protein FtsZ [Stellaceae bacterium]